MRHVPGLYSGEDAITFLANRLDAPDEGASSHWREMHADFSYTDRRISGLRGFGTFTPRSARLARVAHLILRQRWRRFGFRFSDFRRLEGIAHRVARSQGRIFDLDLLRQAVTLAYLRERIPVAFEKNKTLIVIGDGFGAFTSVALAAFPGLRVVTINLIKTLIVDLLYIARAVAGVRISLATDASSLQHAIKELDTGVIALRADDLRLLKQVPATLAVNIASMQEMNPAVIAEYFAVLRSIPRKVFFYCCNRQEKILPDGTMVRFRDYAWSDEDEVLDDALCPWTQQYYSWRPPFIHRLDGPVSHRLVALARLPDAARTRQGL